MMADMTNSLSLGVAAVFIMFSASLLGVVLPLYCSGGGERTEASQQKLIDSPRFRVVRTFAAGIMLGVGFIHLLNDGVSKLESVSLDYPSLGFTLATVGALIVLGFKQIAVMLISRITVSSSDKPDCHAHHGESHGPHKKTECVPEFNPDSHTHEAHEELEVVQQTGETAHYRDHALAIQMIAGTDSISVIVKAYMMEISLAIHSIIIGITLGSLSGAENLPSLRALVIAISFHQFFEGLGLGTVIESARLHLGLRKVIIFALNFAATTPIGVFVGIMITTDRADGEGPTTSELYVTGCLNSIAAGILIYVALVEMVGEDFQHAAIASKADLKIQMFIALTTGTLFMAVLAIWA